ncbi:MAG: hypothetical protein JXP48_13785 [Acidobacteria bacterium]|nr:hypothetical protein [Acidobacteriota bacterium]
MKLQAKILSGFLILAAMLACAGMLSINELRSIGSSVNRLLNDNYRSVNAAKTMLEALEMENSGVLLALSGKWQRGHDSISAGDRMFQQAFETARNNLTVPGEGECVGAIASAYGEYKRLWTRALEERGGEPPLDRYFDRFHEPYTAARASVDVLMKLNEESLYVTASGLHGRAGRAIMPGIVAIVSSLVFVLIFNSFINHYVIRPIVALTREVRSSTRSGSPLTMKIESRDELRDLAAAVRDLSIGRPNRP